MIRNNSKWCIKAAALSVIFALYTPVVNAEESLKIESWDLANGMKVVYIPNHKVPAVSHSVWYYAGAAEDAWGKSGAAHFLEHMMFRGSEKILPGDFSKTVARNGGHDNAFTSYDQIAFFQNISSDKLPLVMELEAERMTHLKLDAEQFKNEKKVIREERRQVLDNNPTRLLTDEMRAVLFRNHEYGRPIIGFDNEIESLTLDDLRSFYKRYYNPSNATLIVAGDISREQLEKLANQYYGVIPAGEKPVKARNMVLEPKASAEITLRNSEAKQSAIYRMYQAPGSTGSDAAHGIPLLVLEYLLGADYTGRLYERLVEKEKLATEVFASYDNASLSKSVFTLGAVPLKAEYMDKINTIIDEETRKSYTSAISQPDLQRAKNKMAAQLIYGQEGLFRMARFVGFSLTSGLDLDYITTWQDKLDAVKVEDVQQAARHLFEHKTSVAGYLLPDGSK